MDIIIIIKSITFLNILFFLCLNHLVTESSSQLDSCRSSFCRAAVQPEIRFPFRMQNQQPAPCGYPGFDLSCDDVSGQTVIRLPSSSGNFTVKAIDYARQNIWLNDPDNCLARRLLSLNLSSSPFSGTFYQDFTLFNCTAATSSYDRSLFKPVRCLSGVNYAVVASSSERAIRLLGSSGCGVIARVAVPVQWGVFQPVMASDLGDDIRLKWGAPRCERCESRGGRCQLESVNLMEVVCRSVAARRGLPRGARYAIIIGVGLPAILCLMGSIYFLCTRLKNYTRQQNHPAMEFSMVVTPQPATALPGLDIRTINSYPKTILGETFQATMPEHSVCSICLCEYKPKETLRSIPECQHCFHAECIDEWLRLNPSCPVCRFSPRPRPLITRGGS